MPEQNDPTKSTRAAPNLEPRAEPGPGEKSPPGERPSITRWLILAAIVIALDQWSKFAVLARFRETERLPVIDGLFDLTLYYNTGAAFSFLAGAGGWQRWFFTIFGLAAAGFIFYLIRESRQLKLFSFGLAMILGGALGNVIDRIIHGKVVDFLLFFQHPYYFPAFNLADSAITLGAICLITDEILRWRASRKHPATP
ncbi:MAG: signal peptidase II [Burkholderiaceae bacterium]